MKSFFICLLLCGWHLSQGQQLNNIYEDSKQLRSLIDPTTGKLKGADSTTWLKIFNKYSKTQATNIKELKDAIEDNPFQLDTLLPPTDNQSLTEFTQDANQGTSFNPLSAPAMAGALTQVIIKRAKEELTAAFFQQFKKALDDNQELAILFPETTAFISHIDAYLYAGFINTLRQAFAHDIANLNKQLKPFLEAPRIKNYIASHPGLNFVYLSIPVSNFAVSISRKEGLANAIRYLYPDENIKAFNENIYSTFVLVTTLSESLRDISGNSEWIKFDDFKQHILSDEKATSFFFGLFYENVKQLRIGGNDLAAIICPAKVGELTSAVRTLLNSYENVRIGLNELMQRLRNSKGTPEDYQYLAEVSVKMLQDLLNNIKGLIPEGRISGDIQRLQSLVNAGQSLLQVSNSIVQGNYSSAVMNFLITVSDLLSIKQNGPLAQMNTSALNANLVSVRAAVESSSLDNKKALARQLDRAKKKLDESSNTVSYSNTELFQKLLQYGSFMAAVSEAKSQAELTDAVDAAILPTGSSAIKHYSSFSLSVNSYIGAGVHWEKYKSGDPANVETWLPTAGVSLPIGVAATLGTNCKQIGAVSLFVSIIDLGAVASFKLSTPDNVESKPLPDFTWQNLLAPGAYVVAGRLFNTPLALGVGIQRGPQLRSISYDAAGGTTIDLSDKQVFRVGAFLSVDIPLINLYSKPKKVQ